MNIPRPVITGTTPDFRPIVSQDENAHADAASYPYFHPQPRPAPVMPAPAYPPALSEAAVAQLTRLHGYDTEALRLHRRFAVLDAEFPEVAACERQAADDAERNACAVRQVLHEGGLLELADRLAAEAAGIVAVNDGEAR